MADRRTNIDIAVIGMSCRFPGAGSAAEYWRNLCEGVESVTFFSEDELRAAGVDEALIADPNYVRAAPMLPDVEGFDAAFFGYSPRDAALMDPQQRLFLEVCWEAMEGAGYEPSRYPGRVGVISTGGGVVTSYLLAKLGHAELPGQTASIAHINNDKDFLSTRVSFKLNLTGPSFTVQSACSSSLLAVHYGCQNLRFGECDAMLVGGSVVRVPQREGYLAEKRNLHSLDGHCRPFDAEGQGTIFGSGVGAVLIKPLERAIADRDHVYAVIRGTAVNNDGSDKGSYTAPSLGPQAQAVSDALALAGVEADSIGYLECHSTGTVVGDPLEIEALGRAFRGDGARRQFCAVGSVKANIGHPEQAAGIAGLIKTSLVLHHGKIPPSINYNTPNPEIDFAASPFFVNDRLRDFEAGERPRRVGLNSLGIGGTNVFAVLEEAPAPRADDGVDAALAPCVLTLSAKTPEALVERVRQFADWLDANPGADAGDLCHTTNVSRSGFAFRAAFAGASVAALREALAGWLRTTGREPGAIRRCGAPQAAFLFPGQGAQSAGMAGDLYRAYPVFRDTLDRCDALARPHLEHGLLDAIMDRGAAEGLIDRTDYTQPGLFAVEYALAELLGSWGVRPGAVIGHSLGEITAACVAGAMTLEDAMRLVCVRGALTGDLPVEGAMAAVIADEAATRAVVDAVAPGLCLAAMNGPFSTVVSGETAPLGRLLDELDRRGMPYRRLRISSGFHSPLVDPVLDAFELAAGKLRFRVPELPLVSNLTGAVQETAPDASYWRAHLRQGVRFAEGIRALAGCGCATYLEVGPHPVLLPMAQACMGRGAGEAVWAATLNRDEPDAQAISAMLAALWAAGHDIDWAAVNAPFARRRIPLPTYPFQRKRHWLDLPAGADAPAPHASARAHPLLGEPVAAPDGAVTIEARVGACRQPWLGDHRVTGAMVLPTTAELEIAAAAARRFFGASRGMVRDVLHHRPVVLAERGEAGLRLTLRPHGPDAARFELAGDGDGPHLTGALRKAERSRWPAFSARAVLGRCGRSMAPDALYARLAANGMDYGPGFRGVREVHCGAGELLARVRLPESLAAGAAAGGYLLHPALLDACLHAYPVLIEGADEARAGHSWLPVSVEAFACLRDGLDDGWAHVVLREVAEDGTRLFDVRVYDSDERPAAEIAGLAVRRLALGAVLPRLADKALDPLYALEWHALPPLPAPGRAAVPARWVVFAEEGHAGDGVGVTLAALLEAAGHRVHIVRRGEALAAEAPRRWTVNEQRPEDFRALFERIDAADDLPAGGVAYLWGLDAAPAEGLRLGALKESCEAQVRGALALLHALAERRGAGRRLWVVTAGAQAPGDTGAVDAGPVEPAQAPLWGLGRTAALEYPGLWGGLVDLGDANDPQSGAAALAAELCAQDGETQVALAGGRRHVARLVHRRLDDLPARAPVVRGDATYLITGGLGMIGRSIAAWLLAQGARHLVLAGRNAGAADAGAVIDPALAGGADIRLVSADIGTEDGMATVMRALDGMPPLRGVVHSAGVLDDGILAQLDWERFEPLFAPRVYGGWLLHEATRGMALDFFILNSSLLSLLGSAGQGNYTASSAFLDALAAHRRACGLPALAINWCAWSEGGLATVSGARGEAMWAALGVEFMAPSEAMAVFDALTRRETGQVAVAVADWRTYAGKTGNPPLLGELVSGEAAEAVAAPARIAGPAVDPAEARGRLFAAVLRCIMDELGFEDALDPDAPLNDSGLDSLMSVSLSNRLEERFGVSVPVGELIDGPSVNRLFERFFGDIEWAPDGGEAHDEPYPAPAPTAMPADIPVPEVATGARELVDADDRGDRRARVLAAVQGLVRSELGFDEELDPEMPLSDAGLDSLLSVRLSNRLEEAGLAVPVGELIDGPSIAQLVDRLMEQADGDVVSDQPSETAAALGVVASAEGALRGQDAGRGTQVDLRVVPFDAPGARWAATPVHRAGGVSVPRRPDGAAARIRSAVEAESVPGATSVDQVTRWAEPKAGGGAAQAVVAAGTPPSASTGAGRWLVAPRPNPRARARLFCFPYAGGGLVSFRSWPEVVDPSIEVVAVEPPGRGTRMRETAVGNLDDFVAGLMPELEAWLDRPAAFFGHCLGGLTMFATLCALRGRDAARHVEHAFACGIRAPHLLAERGAFEDNLLYELLMRPDYDMARPLLAQPDAVLAELIRHFDTPAADEMLAVPKLRALLLPTIRAEFGMANDYRHGPVKPFAFPITSFVGNLDPFVSAAQSAGWGRYTSARFENHVRAGSHFLMAEDRDFIAATIGRALARVDA